MATDLSSSGNSYIAVMFPGQGSQFPGMCSDVVAQDPESRATLEFADEILGYPLSQIMEGKNGDDLNQTVYTQPAIFVHSMLMWRLIQRKIGLKPAGAVGHSLGEYSALCAAGVLSFEDALKLVKIRSEAMNSAQAPGSCGMAAIIGVPHDRISEILSSVRQESVLSIANYNSPDQFVISGSIDAVDRAVEALNREKRSRVVRLPVSSAFHTELMGPATKILEKSLEGVSFIASRIPVIANYSAQPYPTSSGEMRSLLLKQLVSPVLWESCVRKMIEMGMGLFVEIGPGKVLSGLVKRIDRSVSVIAVQDIQAIEELVGAIP
jgi:[acyl-carrier-protein] S-malonyltransferase